MEAPGLAVMTELAMAYGRGDRAMARRLLRVATGLTFWLSVIMLPFLIGLGPVIVAIWSHGRLHASRELIAILAVSTLAYSISLSCQEALMAINRIAAASLMLMLLGLPFLGLCYGLSGAFGVIGTGIAVSAFEAAFALWVVSRVMKIFEIDGWSAVGWLAPPSPALIREQAAVLTRRFRRSPPAPETGSPL